ncbi:hypothetical protein HK100_003855, partial [Physocladia obscura]
MTYADANFTGACQQNTYVVDTVLGAWYTHARLDLPVGLCGHTLTLLDGTVYAVGGSTAVWLPDAAAVPEYSTAPPPLNAAVYALPLAAIASIGDGASEDSLWAAVPLSYAGASASAAATAPAASAANSASAAAAAAAALLRYNHVA